jgi:hypothetical protein
MQNYNKLVFLRNIKIKRVTEDFSSSSSQALPSLSGGGQWFANNHS